jgi:hypothetical protein
VEVWQHHSISGGSKAAGAVLPLRAAMVAMKTLAATVMAGALPTINNQLKAAAAMAMETTTSMTQKSAVLVSAAVWWRQCVISAVAVGSSAAAMFPLFITHDEYFVRCGGNGGRYYDVFDLSSYKFLSGQK